MNDNPCRIVVGTVAAAQQSHKTHATTNTGRTSGRGESSNSHISGRGESSDSHTAERGDCSRLV